MAYTPSPYPVLGDTVTYLTNEFDKLRSALKTITGAVWNGTIIGLAYGGTGADLSATGGTSKVLKQSSAGAVITVGQLAASDLSNGTTGSGNVVLANTPSLITPAIGAATGTSLAATGAVTSSGTAGVGYATGAGSTVTQITSKSTGVTINKTTGQITTHNAALGFASVSFTVTNSTVAATDTIIVNIASGATADAYIVTVTAVAAGSFRIQLMNIAASLSEALVLNFVVIKGVAS